MRSDGWTGSSAVEVVGAAILARRLLVLQCELARVGHVGPAVHQKTIIRPRSGSGLSHVMLARQQPIGGSNSWPFNKPFSQYGKRDREQAGHDAEQ